MDRLLRLLIVAALLVTGCSIGAGETSGSVDIDVLVAEPPPVDWRRDVDGIEVVGSGTAASPDELAIIRAGLAELPDGLLEAAGLSAIYRVRDGGGEVEERTLAFSRGRNIFLIDQTFASDPTVYDMASLLAHELTHVLQFNRLVQSDIDAVVGRIDADPIAASAFVRDFARDAGWTDAGSSAGSRRWSLRDPSGTTEYGATAPDEDMAETVSLAVTGRADQLSTERVQWLEDLLDADAASFRAGKPYVPPGSTRINASEPLYDTQAAVLRTAANADPITFQLPASAAKGAALAAEIETALLQRGLGGSLDDAGDRRLARFSGKFLRGDGVAYWVELWDFRDAPGLTNPPDTPVLTYVILWN